MPDSGVGYAIVVNLIEVTTIKHFIHFVGLLHIVREGFYLPPNEHQDVCFFVRTVGRAGKRLSIFDLRPLIKVQISHL